MATDARVRYTKMMIGKSFVTLLQQKPVQKITVKEICELAEINRATFYKHYLDVFDLLNKTETQFLEELKTILVDLDGSSIKDILTYVMVSFKTEEDTYKAVCSPNGDPGFPAKVFDVCYQFSGVQSQIKLEGFTATQKEWIYQYIARGCNGIFISWLAGGMKEPIAEVADFTERMIESTMKNLPGQRVPRTLK